MRGLCFDACPHNRNLPFYEGNPKKCVHDSAMVDSTQVTDLGDWIAGKNRIIVVSSSEDDPQPSLA